MNANTTESLKNLGFTTNEAKAYLALLGCQPATAYEIAKQAGLPTSKIYETVNKLTGRGVFQTISEEGNQQYQAIEPGDLMQSLRTEMELTTAQLLPELEKIPQQNVDNLIWPINGEAQVQAKVLNLIDEAEGSILISLWPEELDWCSDALQAAEERGVAIALVHFGKPLTAIGATYHHPVEKTLYQEKGGRGLTLVTDSSKVVIANYQAAGEIEGAWSRNQSFVTVAEDYVKHDVYITKVTRFLEGEMKQRFGEDYARLRDVFNADA